ncbi:MAG: hypothetical protein LBK23_04780, partial [Oscillospiraceae bacterium]|nr:hypothetical protein [Oscillospiraceae bacterium]
MSSEYERLKKLAGIEDEQKAASSGFARLKALAGGERAPVAKVIASEMEKRNAELLAERARTYTPAGYSDMPLPGLGIGNAAGGLSSTGGSPSAPTGTSYLPQAVQQTLAREASRALVSDYNAQRKNISGQIEANNAFAWDAEMKERIAALPEALRARVMEFPEKTQIGIDKGKDHSGNNPAYFKALYGDLEKQGINNKLAGEMLTYSERLYNEREMTGREERAREFADEKPVRASAASVPANLAAGAGILDAAAQKAARALTKSRAPVDYNTAAFAPAKFSRTVRGTVTENIGNPVGQFLYGAGMSMADSTVIAGLSAMGVPGAVNLLGGSAATSAALDAKARGASDTQALLFGAASGVAETLFEKISLESLLDKNALAGIGALSRLEALDELARNALRQAGVEATEEGATTIANAITDRIIMGGASEYEQTVLKYRAAGYSAENAKLSAQAEFVKSLAADMAAGALSGGVMGGFTDVGEYSADARRARAGYAAVGGDGAATPAPAGAPPSQKGAGNSAGTGADANPSPVTDLGGGAGAAKYSAMYRNPEESVDSFYDFAVNNRNNSTERNKSFFTYETPKGGNVDLPFDAALHLKDSHNLTGAQVATLLGSIDNIQAWAKAPDVNNNYDGTPLKIITDINGKHAGILLEALPNGRVFVRTAFFGNDNRLADWIRKSDPRALTSDSKAGEYFTGDRLSLDNMLSQLNGDVNTQNAGNG